MLTASEKKTLNALLALSPEPDHTFSLEELTGFVFGLAMTPDIVPPSEWLPVIFGGGNAEYESVEQSLEMTNCLMNLYNRFTGDFHKDKLAFPHKIETSQEEQLERIYEWVSGFEEAISLREELWDPEEHQWLTEQSMQELYHSMMTIQGLIDPTEVMEFFANLPDEAFHEVFPDIETGDVDKEELIQLFLLASLPLSVETLQIHAKKLEKRRQQQFRGPATVTPIRSTKIGRNEPCPCGSGKKHKKCCGSVAPSKAVRGDDISKKSNVIKVDFPQHGTKKTTDPAPIYQLKIGLKGAKPPIWRRIQVPGNSNLAELHQIIQISMGWDDCHLHQFVVDKDAYCLPSEEESFSAAPAEDESQFTLHSLAKKIQSGFQYIYDFGDDWLHQIDVEKTIAHEEGASHPILLTGRRACPPENSGGIPGYMNMLEILKTPENEEHKELAEWLGDNFDPTGFGKEVKAEINETLLEAFPQTT